MDLSVSRHETRWFYPTDGWVVATVILKWTYILFWLE